MASSGMRLAVCVFLGACMVAGQSDLNLPALSGSSSAGKAVAKASGSKILLTVNPNNCTMDAVTTQSWAISLGKNYTVTSFKLNTTAGSPASPEGLIIRVGSVAPAKNLTANPACASINVTETNKNGTFECTKALTGNYISITSASGDMMSVCSFTAIAEAVLAPTPAPALAPSGLAPMAALPVKSTKVSKRTATTPAPAPVPEVVNFPVTLVGRLHNVAELVPAPVPAPLVEVVNFPVTLVGRLHNIAEPVAAPVPAPAPQVANAPAPSTLPILPPAPVPSAETPVPVPAPKLARKLAPAPAPVAVPVPAPLPTDVAVPVPSVLLGAPATGSVHIASIPQILSPPAPSTSLSGNSGTNSQSLPQDSSSGLSTGDKIGIAIGVVAGVTAATLAGLAMYKYLASPKKNTVSDRPFYSGN